MPSIGVRSYFQVAFIECELLEAQNIDAKTSLGQKATPRSSLHSSGCLPILKETGACLECLMSQTLIIETICNYNFVYVTDPSYNLSKAE